MSPAEQHAEEQHVPDRSLVELNRSRMLLRNATPDVTSHTELLEACKLVLLFHDGEEWTFEKRQQWMRGMAACVETSNPVVVGANGDGTWDPNASKYEATTKNLCLAVRSAIAKAKG